LIDRVNGQITEDFGDPTISTYSSKGYIDEHEENGMVERKPEDTILAITSEEYPWAVKTLRDIENGVEN